LGQIVLKAKQDLLDVLEAGLDVGQTELVKAALEKLNEVPKLDSRAYPPDASAVGGHHDPQAQTYRGYHPV
jgi:Fe-S cluster assembly ATPase SufC